MCERIVSSILVVVAGLLPLFLGGPVFAAFMSLLGIVGYREYLGLLARVEPASISSRAKIGYVIVPALSCVAVIDSTSIALLGLSVLAVTLPLISIFPNPIEIGGLRGSSLVTTGSLYLGLPMYAAVATRASSGTVDAAWLEESARWFALGWDPAPRGLAWALSVVLAVWVGDSIALLAGRAFGNHKLAPVISPNKSQEGALIGLFASAATGAISFLSFGLGAWWMGLVAGAVIGFAGQVGDLAESVLKRQVGVKDSGSVIPGHGGILDRIDALLFAFPAGFVMATGLGRLGH